MKYLVVDFKLFLLFLLQQITVFELYIYIQIKTLSSKEDLLLITPTNYINLLIRQVKICNNK